MTLTLIYSVVCRYIDLNVISAVPTQLKELGNAVSKIDQDIQSTMKQIETLTLSVN